MGEAKLKKKENEKLPYKPGDYLPGLPDERIISVLGTGGFATVYLTWNKELEVHHAVKVLHNLSNDARQVFVAEMRVLARLGSENIARIHWYGVTRDELKAPYLVMEYLDGLDLRTLIHVQKKKGRMFDARWVLKLAIGLFDGLAAAHAIAVIHRDLKPENIFIVSARQHARDDDKPESIPKILDFGSFIFSGLKEQRLEDNAPIYRGTPRYSPWEQFVREVREQADLYTVGIILYECLAGRTPFHRVGLDDFRGLAEAHRYEHPRPIRDIRPDLPELIGGFVDSLLEKEPNERGVRCLRSLIARQPRSDAREEGPDEVDGPLTAQQCAEMARELVSILDELAGTSRVQTFEHVQIAGKGTKASATPLRHEPRFLDTNATEPGGMPLFDTREIGPEPEPYIGPELEELAARHQNIVDAKALSQESAGEVHISLRREASQERLKSTESREQETWSPPSREAQAHIASQNRTPRIFPTEVLAGAQIPAKPSPIVPLPEATDPSSPPESGKSETASDADASDNYYLDPEAAKRLAAQTIASPEGPPHVGASSTPLSTKVAKPSPQRAGGNAERALSPQGKRRELRRHLIDGWAGPFIAGAIVAAVGLYIIVRYLPVEAVPPSAPGEMPAAHVPELPAPTSLPSAAALDASAVAPDRAASNAPATEAPPTVTERIPVSAPPTSPVVAPPAVSVVSARAPVAPARALPHAPPVVPKSTPATSASTIVPKPTPAASASTRFKTDLATDLGPGWR